MTISDGTPAPISPDEEAQRILVSVGLDSVPIDPSSMMVLKQMVVHRQEEKVNKAAFARALRADGHLLEQHKSMPSLRPTENAGGDSLSKPIVSDSISGHNVATSIGTLKKPPPGSLSSTLPSQSGESKGADTHASSAVLEQLKFQTSLLLDLQQKIEMLNDKVERLEKKSASIPSRPDSTSGRSGESNQYILVRQPRIITRNHDNQQQQQRQQDEANQGEDAPRREQAAVADVFVNALQNPMLWPLRVFLTCIRFELRLTYEFFTRLRAEMRPLDGGIFFQLLFVGMVFSSRIDPTKNPEKFLILSMVVAVGMLYQLKFWDVFFRFFIKERAPERMWREMNGLPPLTEEHGRPNHHVPAGNGNGGNDFNVNRQGGQRALQDERQQIGGIDRQAADGGANDGGVRRQRQNGNLDPAWRNMFVMGGIYQRQQDGEDAAARNPVLGLAWDVFYLFGSFVFSIFPMWNPQARGGPGRPRPFQAAARDEGVEGGVDGRERGIDEIPQVQAPRDAMVPADSDDDNDDDE